MNRQETKESAPVTAFLDMNQVARTWPRSTTPPRQDLSILDWPSPCCGNYDPFQAPTHSRSRHDEEDGQDLQRTARTTAASRATARRATTRSAARTAGTSCHRRACVQDLFNYDFRRTEQCIIPYATQEARSASAPTNTGVVRNIIEEDAHDGTLTKWYRSTAATRSSPAARRWAMSQVGHELS